MVEQPKRWFQLSLTTCIVMMFVASLLVWGNLAYNYPDSGWPFRHGLLASYYVYDWEGSVYLNTLVALLILTATATISEYLIRRRGRRKQEVEA